MSKKKRKRMTKSNRRQIVLLLFLLIVIGVALYYVLKNRPGDELSSPGSRVSPGTPAAESTTEDDFTVPEVPFYTAARITDAEAEAIFRAANEFYVTWILHGPSIDYGDGYESRIVAHMYLPVTEPGFSTLAQIKSVAAAYFGEGAFEDRINGLYLEKNGKLYAKMRKGTYDEDAPDDADEPTGRRDENWSEIDMELEDVELFHFRLTDREKDAINFRVRIYTDEAEDDYVTVTNRMRLTRGFPPFNESFNAVYGYAGAGLHGEDGEIEVEVWSEPETEPEPEPEETEEADED